MAPCGRVGAVARAPADRGGGGAGTRPDPGHPRRLLAAFLSSLLPGLGQLATGRRRRGWILLAIAGLIGAPFVALTVAVLYLDDPGFAIDLIRPFFEHPGLLLVLLAASGLLLLFRAYAVFDAFLLPGRRGGSRWGRVPTVPLLALVAILAVVIVPHVWAAERNLALYDLFTHDFTADPGQATTSTAASPPPTTTTTVGASDPVTTSTTSMSTTSTSTTSTSTTTTTLPDPFEGYGRVNVLLLGGDAGPGRWGIRTDTMIVVSIDPQTGATALFSIPRNMRRVPFPEGIPAYDLDWCHCYRNQINALYQHGLAWPDRFPGGPNSGGNAIKGAIGEMLGIEIHFFALVDLRGFVDVIDAVGGVTITVIDRIYDSRYPHEDGGTIVVDIPPGTHHMDGHTALAYARSRRTSDDYTRMGRQRCVIEALAEQADPFGLLRALPGLVPAIEGSIVTDIPIADVPDFLDLLSRADLETIPSIRFMPDAPEHEGTRDSYLAGWTPGGYPMPDVDFVRATVQTVLSLPPLEAIETLGLQPMEEVCG